MTNDRIERLKEEVAYLRRKVELLEEELRRTRRESDSKRDRRVLS